MLTGNSTTVLDREAELRSGSRSTAGTGGQRLSPTVRHHASSEKHTTRTQRIPPVPPKRWQQMPPPVQAARCVISEGTSDEPQDRFFPAPAGIATWDNP